MGENRIPSIAVAIPDEYREHLTVMAKEADISLGGIISSMLLDVVDDDRHAHGLPKLSRNLSYHAGRK